MVLGWLMYYKDDRDQLGIDEFFLPFGGKLNKDNRWVRTAEIMPWDDMEEVYLKSMSQEDRPRGVSCAYCLWSDLCQRTRRAHR